MFCPSCGTEISNDSTFCSNCGVAIANDSATSNSPTNTNELGMKWYKFLIYFALFAGAVLNAINGIQLISGNAYGEKSDFYYAFFKGLRVGDAIIGIICIVLAVFAIYVRFRLAQYRADGPKLILLFYAAVTVLNILTLVFALIIIPSNYRGDMTSSIITIVVNIVMFIANKVYFDKRGHLFNK